MLKYFFLTITFLLLYPTQSFSQAKLLIPMEFEQTDHLRAYGIAYRHLLAGQELDWLLNYRGGSFMFDYSTRLENECREKGVYFEAISGTVAAQVYSEIQREDRNMEIIRLEKVARIAVYVPPDVPPWDDAVQLALDYAEIPYDKLWNKEVLGGELKKYDWLHLHHEDFTGQYGKFFGTFGTTPWYIEQVRLYEETARSLGFEKVSRMKLAVVKELNEYIYNGGFLFTMCSATDTYDIALAAQYTDICDVMYDGDPYDPQANEKLDFSECIAFQNFQVLLNPYVYEYSNIDVTNELFQLGEARDFISLVDFSAKLDPVPTMLNQCHTALVKGFLGQTSGFRREFLKPGVTILGMNEGTDYIRYIHGNHGRGTFTFFAGHDPEDYTHAVGDPATDLSLHKNSPGYRLILNNVLFPAAKKKKLKT